MGAAKAFAINGLCLTTTSMGRSDQLDSRPEIARFDGLRSRHKSAINSVNLQIGSTPYQRCKLSIFISERLALNQSVVTLAEKTNPLSRHACLSTDAERARC